MHPTGFTGGTLYFAYGANLCRAHMALWCPSSAPLVQATLPEYRLVFRRWADIVASPGGLVPGALYEVGPRDLISLDAFEDCPALYRRIHVRVVSDRCFFDAMAYRMAGERALASPDPDYVNIILRGYRDWGLDPGGLARLARPAGTPRRPGEGEHGSAGRDNAYA